MNNRPTYDPLDQALARRVGSHSVVGGEDWAAFSARRAGVPVRRPRRWLAGAVAAAVVGLGVLVGGSGYLLGWYDRVEEQALAMTEVKLDLGLKQESVLDRAEKQVMLAQAKPVRPKESLLAIPAAGSVSPITAAAFEPEKEEAVMEGVDRPKTRQQETGRTSPGSAQATSTRSVRPNKPKLSLGAYASLGSSGSNTERSHQPRSAVAMDYTVGKYDGNWTFSPSELQHDFPVSVGVALDIPLVPRLRLSTGLFYTYIRSSAGASTGVNYHYEQQLHYLGIPVSVAYDFFVSRPVDLYVTGGAAAEWAVASSARSEVRSATGELLSEERKALDTHGLMVSFNVGLGVGVRLSPRVGLYVEPGVTGYLPNDSHPVNFRTATPVQFSLRAGVRVKL